MTKIKDCKTTTHAYSTFLDKKDNTSKTINIFNAITTESNARFLEEKKFNPSEICSNSFDMITMQEEDFDISETHGDSFDEIQKKSEEFEFCDLTHNRFEEMKKELNEFDTYEIIYDSFDEELEYDNNQQAIEENADTPERDMDFQSVWITSTPIGLSPIKKSIQTATTTTTIQQDKADIFFKKVDSMLKTMVFILLIIVLIVAFHKKIETWVKDQFSEYESALGRIGVKTDPEFRGLTHYYA